MKRYIRSSFDLSEYQQLSSTIQDGGDIYALFRKKKDDKTLWAAAKYKNGEPQLEEAFAISYDQARGFEPLSDIGRLSREVGKKVFGAAESYQLYRNKRNENKYLEVKKTTDGHTWFRTFMFWNTDRGPVKNYYGSASNKGRYSRVRQNWLEQLLEDYDQVEGIEDDVKYDFDYDGSPENPNEFDFEEQVNKKYEVTSADTSHLPEYDEWPPELTFDTYPEGDQIIEVLIDVVGDLDLFEEPSGQGGTGTDYFYNEDGDVIGEIDLQQEEEELKEMFYTSRSQSEFKDKVKVWMKSLCNLNY